MYAFDTYLKHGGGLFYTRGCSRGVDPPAAIRSIPLGRILGAPKTVQFRQRAR